MALIGVLETIAQRLRSSGFPNEQAIKQGIVMRLLAELGWDTYEPTIVWPEYSVASRRVDYALCEPPKRPTVFIEVKQPGLSDGADRQLFEYAFHAGVPLAVLTTGQIWSFYFPSGLGDYNERKFCELNLMLHSLTEVAEKLDRYLALAKVSTGEARRNWQQDYEATASERQTRNVLPQAWDRLLSKADPTLIDRLSQETVALTGLTPSRAVLSEFLQSLSRRSLSAETVAPRPLPLPPAAPPPQRQPLPSLESPKPAAVAEPSSGPWYRLGTTVYSVKSGKAVVLGLLREFQRRDPRFLERCAAREENTGSKRCYVARTPLELYFGSQHHSQDPSMYAEIVPGWYLMTNFSNSAKHSLLRFASEVANHPLREGIDYALE